MATFIDAINAAIQEHRPGSRGLSRTQRWWLGICLMGIMITNSVCWARFERATLGCYSLAALAWMFRHAKVPWELLLQMSVQVLLKRYGVTAGVLVIESARPTPLLTMEDLDRVIRSETAMPPGILVSPLSPREYVYLAPGMKEKLRVTTDPSFYEKHAESIELWAPGSPLFPEPEVVAALEDLPAGTSIGRLIGSTG